MFYTKKSFLTNRIIKKTTGMRYFLKFIKFAEFSKNLDRYQTKDTIKKLLFITFSPKYLIIK